MSVNKPLMGWNSSPVFGSNVNERIIIETADAMVAKGLRDAGYEYVIIDGGWTMRGRDEEGKLAADPEKFPHGVKYLADYLHAKGLKLGLSSFCREEDDGYPGSLGHELADAKFFAANGVDLLKYEGCGNDETMALCNRMSMALGAVGSDITMFVDSVGCSDWARSVGGVMYNAEESCGGSFSAVIAHITKRSEAFNLSASGCFRGMETLSCGCDCGWTYEEYASQFKLWCMLGTPLMLGCDIRTLDGEMLALVTNRELIAIDRDPECRQAIYPKLTDIACDPITFFRHLDGGDYALSITNPHGEKIDYVYIHLINFGIPADGTYGFRLSDVESGEEIGTFTDSVTIPFADPHVTYMYRGKLVKLR